MDTLHQPLYLLVLFAFMMTVLMHVSHKNSNLVLTYALQSLSVACVIGYLALKTGSLGLTISALLTLLVKVLIAPRLFDNLIRRHQLPSTAASYLNVPVTLLIILGLTSLSRSSVILNLIPLSSDAVQALPLAVSALLISLFLILNRKGALSQVLGILSFENAIVLCASFMGIEQSISFELGITFDISVWVAIASVFILIVYRHFGTLDVTTINKLID